MCFVFEDTYLQLIQ